MTNPSSAIVQKLWSYCNVLLDAGLTYLDYTEQLTYLLFLKMAHERTQEPWNQPSAVPSEYAWPTLASKDGDALEAHYRHTLEELGKKPGMLGTIFRKAQNKVQDPAILRRLVVDLIGSAPRHRDHRKRRSALRDEPDAARHRANRRRSRTADHDRRQSESGSRHTRFDLVLTNPPFGKKSSIRVVNEEGQEEREALTVERQDFWASTSNKQLNFLQHVRTLLKINGCAAIVVPDNVLFEGGAGETIRRKLLAECDVHTLLRLPTGLFCAQGVKANVLFFDKKPGAETPWTKQVWIYDLRTNKHFTLKTNPLKRSDLDDFVASFKPDNRNARAATERFRPFSYDEIILRDKASLDVFWLKDDSLEDLDSLPEPEVLAEEIAEGLRAALEQFNALAESLERAGKEQTG